MSVMRYWADALHPHEPRIGTIYVKKPVVFAEDYDALRAERDELLGMREEVLHYQREFHRLRDERDEAVALLREAPLGQHDRGWWNRIEAFLAKLGAKP